MALPPFADTPQFRDVLMGMSTAYHDLLKTSSLPLKDVRGSISYVCYGETF